MITFEINELPPMANGKHGHWRAKAALTKKWQHLTMLALLGKKPKTPFEKILVRFIRFSSSEPDFDGLVHGFKPIADGIVMAGIVKDDNSQQMQRLYSWQKAGPKKGKIRIEIEEL